MAGVDTDGALDHIAALIDPTAGGVPLLGDLAVQERVLIPRHTLEPGVAHQGAVDHDVDLLAVVPALGVLVAVALDGDVAVDDHQLDVAAAVGGRARLVDRPRLVFRHVRVDAQVGVEGGFERAEEVVGDRFVVAALERE